MCFKETTSNFSENDFGYNLSMFVAAFFLFGTTMAASQETTNGNGPDPTRYITLQVENDLFGNLEPTDRHYTNGLQLSFLSEELELSGLLYDIATTRVPFGYENASPAKHRLGVAFGHSIFTPANVLATTLQVDDRPYASWAHLTFSLQTEWTTSESSSFQDQWKFDVGMVGPVAEGEFVQNTVHEIVNSEVISGWRHQLPNEVGLNVSFERSWNSPDLDLPSLAGFQMDVVPYVTAAVGNIQTYLGAGGSLRFGHNLPPDFGPSRIYPGVGGSEAFQIRDGWSWYLFTGIESRLVGRDMFLDGTLFSDSHSVDKRVLVSDLRLGAVFTIYNLRITATQVHRTKEFFGQPHPDKFGAITVGIGF